MASWVSLAQAKDMMNMGPNDTAHDGKIQLFIDAATPVIEYIVGPVLPRVITAETHFTGGNQSSIVLRTPPILSVELVTEYIGTTGYRLTVQNPGSTVDNYGFTMTAPTTGVLVRMSSVGTAMPFLGDVVTVNYTAGLAVVPADITLAAIEDIRAMVQQTQLGGRPQYGGGAAQEDGWQPGPIASFPRLRMLLERARRTPSIA